MFEVSVQLQAEEDLNAAAEFYESREPGLGETFLDEVSLCFDRIQQYPLLGTPLFDEFRRLPAQRFPYSVIYRIDNESIFILAIAHSSRRPGYWRHRK